MKNLILDMFNVEEENIELFESFNDNDGNVKVKIRLRKDEYYCPRCDKKLILMEYEIE